jgi:hypothetical protein
MGNWIMGQKSGGVMRMGKNDEYGRMRIKEKRSGPNR